MEPRWAKMEHRGARLARLGAKMAPGRGFGETLGGFRETLGGFCGRSGVYVLLELQHVRHEPVYRVTPRGRGHALHLAAGLQSEVRAVPVVAPPLRKVELLVVCVCTLLRKALDACSLLPLQDVADQLLHRVYWRGRGHALQLGAVLPVRPPARRPPPVRLRASSC